MSEPKAITVDHVVLYAHDNEASAKLFAAIMGLSYEGADRHFAPVRVNASFHLAFLNSDNPQGSHVAFHLTEEQFDTVFENLKAMNIVYGDDPRAPDNMGTQHPFGGRGAFWTDDNGHLFEVMTRRGPS